MIVVTGATGAFGSAVVECLLERIPAAGLAVSVRDPQRAQHLVDRGVRVRHGDFSDPTSLDHAFAGAEQVLVVSVDLLGPVGVARSVAAIDAACRAGAQRVLYTSHQAADADSLFAPARDHAAVEAHLRSINRPYTALRNGYYASSLQFHLNAIRTGGELVSPADGPISWTSRADLAAAAAALLTGPGVDGPTPPLVAEPIDLDQVASILSNHEGTPVRHVVVHDEEWVRRQVAAGMPSMFVQTFLDTYRAARRGEFDVHDTTLPRLLGRDVEQILTASGISAFQGRR